MSDKWNGFGELHYFSSVYELHYFSSVYELHYFSSVYEPSEHKHYRT